MFQANSASPSGPAWILSAMAFRELKPGLIVGNCHSTATRWVSSLHGDLDGETLEAYSAFASLLVLGA